MAPSWKDETPGWSPGRLDAEIDARPGKPMSSFMPGWDRERLDAFIDALSALGKEHGIPLSTEPKIIEEYKRLPRIEAVFVQIDKDAA